MLWANEAVYDDPCDGENKYLRVFYDCAPSPPRRGESGPDATEIIIVTTIVVVVLIAIIVVICICIKQRATKNQPKSLPLLNANATRKNRSGTVFALNPYHLAEFALTDFVKEDELRTEGNLEKG